MMRTALVLVVACAAPRVRPPENRAGDQPSLQIGPVSPGRFYVTTVRGRAVTIIDASINGEVEEAPRPSTDEVHRIVTMHASGLRDCFVAHGASGTTQMTLILEPDGTARATTWNLPKVDHCIADKVRGWERLPRPTGSGGPRQRQYTFDVTLIERLRQR